jgi:small subunit ribosomal protein S1
MADTQSDKSSVMAKLLASYKSPLKSLQRGEQVEGRVTKVTRQEMLVDVNAKSEALVIEKDRRIHNILINMLKPGDAVMATVINPESESGIPLVSLRKFVEAKAWDTLAALQKDHKTLDVTVTDLTKGGYVVAADAGLTGFLPNSHMSGGGQVQVGQRLTVSVLEMQREENKIIFTQKTTLAKEDFERLTKAFPVGHKMSATIASIAPFGIFLSIPSKDEKTDKTISVDGLVHISEVAWEKTADISEKYAVGDSIDVVVLGYDKDSGRIDFSIKRLTEDPFEAVAKEYPVDKKLTAPVLKTVAGVVHLDLGNGVEGIIPKEKVPPTTSYEVGQQVNVTISDIDTKRHKIFVSPVLLEKPLGYR